MKNYISSLLIATTCALSSCLQSNNQECVPTLVSGQFKKDFKEAGKLQWECKEGAFEATFIEKGTEKIVTYSAEGKQVELAYYVSEEKVPAVVISHINAQYPEMAIEHVSYVERQSQKPFYIVRIKHNNYLSTDQLGKRFAYRSL
jgi:hypothetical protein